MDIAALIYCAETDIANAKRIQDSRVRSMLNVINDPDVGAEELRNLSTTLADALQNAERVETLKAHLTRLREVPT